MQFHYHGVTESMHQTYQSGLMTYMSFCARFDINPLLATSLTLLGQRLPFADNQAVI